jgi:nitroreductase
MLKKRENSLSKEESIIRRYGKVEAPILGPWTDEISLLLSHRSVRSYKPDALPEGTLQTLMAAAQSAATSSNLQLWSLVAITDSKKKSELAKIAGNQKHIEQCPLFLVWLADLSRNQRLGAEEGVDMEVMPFVETFLVAAIDAALAAQNAVIAAEALDLSTVYIGAMRNNPKRVAELLELPSEVFGVFGLCVGYASSDVETEVKPRLPQPAVAFHEVYGNADETRLRAIYDVEMEGFSKRHEMVSDTWSKKVLGRMGKLSAMNGREKLMEILRSMGFRLR